MWLSGNPYNRKPVSEANDTIRLHMPQAPKVCQETWRRFICTSFAFGFGLVWWVYQILKKHQLSGVVPPSILLSKMTKINSMLGGNLVKTWAIDYYLMDHKLNKFWQYKIRPLLYKLFESLTNQTRGLRHNLLILNFWYLKTKIQNISLSCLMTFIYKLSFPAAKV